MSAPKIQPFTYREYALLPSDGRRWELIDGDFYVSPAPAPRHQTVSRRLQHALMSQLEDTGIAQIFDAPIDVIFSGTNTVQPDLVLVRMGREHFITRRAIECVPDLVVEILSPSNRAHDVVLKRQLYARFKVPEFWLIDPEDNTLELLRLDVQQGTYSESGRFSPGDTLVSPEFPQVAIELSKVFRAP